MKGMERARYTLECEYTSNNDPTTRLAYPIVIVWQ